MRQILAAIAMTSTLLVASAAHADYYVEYYRDNLFLGLAYHRIGCLTDWSTIRSGHEYDGFTTANYCVAGASAASVPGGTWFDYTYLSSSQATAQSRLDSCGASTNNKYGTLNYAARSTTCSYNVTTNCNSDCWIRYFSTCVGDRVSIASTCFGYSYP